uniref:Putative salivary secreted proline-rich mucin n=1 Tax=Psorophora albipes TaxID=869069 RepID=T1D5I5_9DIPT
MINQHSLLLLALLLLNVTPRSDSRPQQSRIINWNPITQSPSSNPVYYVPLQPPPAAPILINNQAIGVNCPPVNVQVVANFGGAVPTTTVAPQKITLGRIVFPS